MLGAVSSRPRMSVHQNPILGIDTSKTHLNPRRPREFARAAGYLGKTDKVDARMLAHFRAVMKPAPTSEQDPARDRLHQLFRRREQLVEMHKQEKIKLRQTQSKDIRGHIDGMIGMFDQHIARFEIEIRQEDSRHNQRYDPRPDDVRGNNSMTNTIALSCLALRQTGKRLLSGDGNYKPAKLRS